MYRSDYLKSMYGEKCIQMHNFMHDACAGGGLFFLWKFKDYFYGNFESCLSTIGAWGQKLWKIFNSFGAANEPVEYWQESPRKSKWQELANFLKRFAYGNPFLSYHFITYFLAKFGQKFPKFWGFWRT